MQRTWTRIAPIAALAIFGLASCVSAQSQTASSRDALVLHRGLISGINNAIARVAGVLAVAVMGFVMAAAFAHSLRRALDRLHLNAVVVQYLESNVT